MHENDIIQLFSRASNAIGDDAAVVKLDEYKSYCVSKDILVEDVHFRTSYFSPRELAHKLIHVNMSDIAAMGAIPQYILFGISAPKSIDSNYIKAFIKALIKICKNNNLTILGGDTTLSRNSLYISASILSTVDTLAFKLRSDAIANDYICLIGDIGHSYIGLRLLESNISGYNKFKKASKTPIAKCLEGRYLGQCDCVHAIIDLSDGLFTDLNRICKLSNLSAVINLESLSLQVKNIQSVCSLLNLDPLSCIFSGGEDYSLLITVNESEINEFLNNFRQKFGVKSITCIGQMVRNTNKKSYFNFLNNNNSFLQNRIILQENGGFLKRNINLDIYEHFKK